MSNNSTEKVAAASRIDNDSGDARTSASASQECDQSAQERDQVALYWQQHFMDKSDDDQEDTDTANAAGRDVARCRRTHVAEQDDTYTEKQPPSETNGATVRRRRPLRRGSTGTFQGAASANNHRLPARHHSTSQGNLATGTPSKAPAQTQTPAAVARSNSHSTSQSTSNSGSRRSMQRSRSNSSSRRSMQRVSSFRMMARRPQHQLAQRRGSSVDPNHNRKDTAPTHDAAVNTSAATTSRSGRRGGRRATCVAQPTQDTVDPPIRRSNTAENQNQAASIPNTTSTSATSRPRIRRRTSLSFNNARSRSPARRPTASRPNNLGVRRSFSMSSRIVSPQRAQLPQPQQQHQIALEDQLMHMSEDLGKREEGELQQLCAQSSSELETGTPGAYCVSGIDATGSDSEEETSTHHEESGIDTSASSEIEQPTQTTRRPSDSVLAVATAVVVDDSRDSGDIQHERDSLVQRQLELKEQEERLAEQAARLKAWEDELEQRRQALDGQQPIVQASQVVTEPTIAPVTPTKRRPRLMRTFLSGRSLSMGEDLSSNSGADNLFSNSNNNSFASQVSRIVSVGGSSTRTASRGHSPMPLTSIESGSITAQVSRVVDSGITLPQQQETPPQELSSLPGGMDMALARAELGDGPLRFAPPVDYVLGHVVSKLSSADQVAFRRIKDRWEDRQDKRLCKYGSNKKKIFDLPLQWHLRYLHLCAKQHKKHDVPYFSVEKAWTAEKKVERRFLSLNVFQLKEQIQSKTLFPVPGLKTSGGHDMFYMRPSRYFPNKTSVKTIIDNLCYVMNTMLDNDEFAQKEGIGFIACMDDWKMKNFDVKYCLQFMLALQGFMIPVKTQLFLIVNPPSWFGGIWKIMKPMLAPSFRKRVKIVPERKIEKYLAPGFEQYLPNDMKTGMADTNTMIADFVTYRQLIEKDISQQFSHSGSDVRSLASSHEGSHCLPMPHRLNDQDIQGGTGWSGTGWSLSSDPSGSLGSSVSRFSHSDQSLHCGSDGGWYEDVCDGDEASIHCDISDEEMMDDEDMKEPARPAESPIHVTNKNMMGE